MKKSLILLLTVICSLYSGYSFSQNKAQNKSQSGGKCYDENTHLITIGVGFNSSYYKFNKYTGYSYGRTPVFLVGYEQPLHNKVGPGYIGVGGVVTYQNAHERWDYDYWYNGSIHKYYNRQNWDYFNIVGKASYHWDGLNSSKAELYGGAMIGVRINAYRYTTNNQDPNYVRDEWHEGAVDPVAGVYIGGRYYLAPNVALYSEIATAVSWISGGLTFKF